MKRVFFSCSFFVFAFSACSAPQLDQSLFMELKENKIKEATKQIHHIKIYQSFYRCDNIISYEYAKAEIGYKFNYSLSKIVSIVFARYADKKIYSKGDYSFFTLHNKFSDEILYLIVVNENKKVLKFLYGFEKEQFFKLLNHFKDDQAQKDVNISCRINNKDLSNNNLIEINKYIKSNWNNTNIILDQLAIPVSQGIRRVGK